MRLILMSIGHIVLHGDCREVLKALPTEQVDAIVTDPPYELGFMGKAWDSSGIAYDTAMWAECLRVLKPGGHLLAFGGTRTYHRMTCAIEDAGFEIRDGMSWLYGSGFPKSLDVSKAIDKRRDWTALPKLQAKVREARSALGISQSEAARRTGLIAPSETLGGGGFMWFETGMRVPTREQYPRLKAALGLDDECDLAFEEAEREVTGTHVEWKDRTNYALTSRDGLRRDHPATPDAARWQGWGTALKPSHEPIVVARKPLIGTVAANVLAHGAGALNIDACRVQYASDADRDQTRVPTPVQHNDARGVYQSGTGVGRTGEVFEPAAAGRWPTNVILSHAEDCEAGRGGDGVFHPAIGPRCAEDCAVAELDAQSGTRTSGSRKAGTHDVLGYHGGSKGEMPAITGDSGGASRFFPVFRYCAKAPSKERPVGPDGTKHATVKPLALMRWLVRLVTPPGGIVLDPFAGSGTTVEACTLEGFDCIAIERDAVHLPLIQQRINRANAEKPRPMN